ncbi:MAG: metal ABC transporter permease, partial [Duncaniella sp.]|nr:metal ABC transporter permease [Duncaniella sp.]
MELFNYDFFRNAFIGIFLLSVASAVIGTYIVTRRLVSISGGVTHACFGGLGLGYFLGWNPVVMAAVFAIGSSLGVQWMSRRHRVREDSAIAVIWALGMALGTLFMFLTPGYVPELNAFLFGNVLTITRGDLWSFGIFT